MKKMKKILVRGIFEVAKRDEKTACVFGLFQPVPPKKETHIVKRDVK